MLCVKVVYETAMRKNNCSIKIAVAYLDNRNLLMSSLNNEKVKCFQSPSWDVHILFHWCLFSASKIMSYHSKGYHFSGLSLDGQSYTFLAINASAV